MRTVIPILLSSTSEVVNPKMSHLKSVPHQKWFWDEKAGYWIPAGIENHHGSSALQQRLLERGLICEKSPEEINRDRQWQSRLAEHARKIKVFRRRTDALAALIKKEGYRVPHRKQSRGFGCIFCHKRESRDVYICSECCTRLLSAHPESLRMAYLLAVWHGHKAEADTLRRFLSPTIVWEVEDEIQSTKNGTYDRAKKEDISDERETHGVRRPDFRGDFSEVAQPSIF